MRSVAKHPAVDSHEFAQLNLVVEDITDLQRELVKVLGGNKAVAEWLFPDKDAESAHRYLLDCLNPDRPHEMGIGRLFALLKKARAKGIHFGKHWIDDELGYTRSTPIEPEDARAALQRQFLAGVEDLKQLARRLER